MWIGLGSKNFRGEIKKNYFFRFENRFLLSVNKIVFITSQSIKTCKIKFAVFFRNFLIEEIL